METAKHKKNAEVIANGGVVVPGKQALRSRRRRANNKAAKKYPCPTCVMFFAEASNLRRHLGCSSHLAAAAAADAAIEAPGLEHAVDEDSEYDSDCGSDFLSDMDSDALDDLGRELEDCLLIANGDSDDTGDESGNAILDTVDALSEPESDYDSEPVVQPMRRTKGNAFSDTVRPQSDSDSEPVVRPGRRAKARNTFSDTVHSESDSDSEPVVRPGRRPKPKQQPKGKGKAMPEPESESEYESSFVVSDSYISYEESSDEDLD
jgi:hypothetical protein